MRRLSLILFVGMFCFPAAANAANFTAPSKASLAGKKVSPGAVRLSSRALYLRFSVPSDWMYYSTQLVLSPASASSGVKVRAVKVDWKDGVAHRVRDRSAAIASPTFSKGVGARVDLSSLLQPGGTYNLQLTGNVKLSQRPYLLRVDTPYQLSAVGDIACPTTSSQWNGGAGTATRCGQARTANLVSAADRSVLLLGDLQYSSGELSQLQSAFGPSWAGFSSRMRPVPGNHEYASGSAQDYFSYMASLGVSTGKDGYYAFDAGAWRIIALNSNDKCAYVSCAAGSEQEQFLREELSDAREEGRCTLAYWHHPRFSGGSHGDNLEVSALFQAMSDLGGDVILSGHDHDYERYGPMSADGSPSSDGPVQWVVGTGGYSFYPVVEKPGAVKAITDVFGLLRLRLYRSSYTFEWVGENGAGSDAGSSSCRP